MARANYPMKLDGPSNVRDLGGYPTKDKRYTRWGQFLRSDNPFSLTAYDCETLYRYGVRLQIDLRSGFECEKEPSALKGYRDVEFCNCSMIDQIYSSAGAVTLPGDISQLYLYLLEEGKAKYAYIFRKVLCYPETCVLFNCTAGKDRTGVLAMLLLKIADCPDEVILADYAATYENLRRDIEKSLELFKERGIALDPVLLLSDPETMGKTLSYLEKKYGDVTNWLVSTGLKPEEIAGLQKKLLGVSP